MLDAQTVKDRHSDVFTFLHGGHLRLPDRVPEHVPEPLTEKVHDQD